MHFAFTHESCQLKLMSVNSALAYSEAVNQSACDEFSSDFQMLTESLGDASQEFERELVEFWTELQHAAAETRQLIAEIAALTR